MCHYFSPSDRAVPKSTYQTDHVLVSSCCSSCCLILTMASLYRAYRYGDWTNGWHPESLFPHFGKGLSLSECLFVLFLQLMFPIATVRGGHAFFFYFFFLLICFHDDGILNHVSASIEFLWTATRHPQTHCPSITVWIPHWERRSKDQRSVFFFS